MSELSAFDANIELSEMGAVSAMAEIWNEARNGLNDHIVDCVSDDTIDLLSVILPGLGLTPDMFENDDMRNLRTMLETLVNVAIMRSGRYVMGRGQSFDKSILSDDGTSWTIPVDLPTLSGLTPLV
jgi:hypothetical protein